MDYRYVLFDTRPWDFRKEKNREPGKNVFLLSALALMPTLAQRLRDEGRYEGIKEGIKETAKRMLLNDFSVEEVITATGLTEKEIRALIN